MNKKVRTKIAKAQKNNFPLGDLKKMRRKKTSLYSASEILHQNGCEREDMRKHETKDKKEKAISLYSFLVFMAKLLSGDGLIVIASSRLLFTL